MQVVEDFYRQCHVHRNDPKCPQRPVKMAQPNGLAKTPPYFLDYELAQPGTMSGLSSARCVIGRA